MQLLKWIGVLLLIAWLLSCSDDSMSDDEICQRYCELFLKCMPEQYGIEIEYGSMEEHCMEECIEGTPTEQCIEENLSQKCLNASRNLAACSVELDCNEFMLFLDDEPGVTSCRDSFADLMGICGEEYQMAHMQCSYTDPFLNPDIVYPEDEPFEEPCQFSQLGEVSINNPDDSRAMIVDGDFAYILYSSELAIYDISQPELPRLVTGVRNDFSNARSIEVSEGFIHIACSRLMSELVTYDWRDKAVDPILLRRDNLALSMSGDQQAIASSLSNEVRVSDLLVTTDYVYVSAWIRQSEAAFDMSIINLAELRANGPEVTISTASVGNGYIGSMASAGNILFAEFIEANYAEDVYLKIFDISTPTSPVELSALQMPGYITRIVPVGDTLFVGISYEDNEAENPEVLIINVSDKSFPSQQGAIGWRHSSSGAPWSLEIREPYLYLLDKEWIISGDFHVFDISDISNPTEPYEYYSEYDADRLALNRSEQYNALYLLNDAESLKTISLCQPKQ